MKLNYNKMKVVCVELKYVFLCVLYFYWLFTLVCVSKMEMWKYGNMVKYEVCLVNLLTTLRLVMPLAVVMIERVRNRTKCRLETVNATVCGIPIQI